MFVFMYSLNPDRWLHLLSNIIFSQESKKAERNDHKDLTMFFFFCAGKRLNRLSLAVL